MAGKDQNKFLNIIRLMRDIHSEFPLNYALCIADIFINEDTNPNSIAKRLGFGPSVIYRILARLETAPYEMITLEHDPNSKKFKRVVLSTRGKNFLRRISSLMDKKN